MKSIIGFFIFMFIGQFIAYAQSDVITDTLDWRGYYPLEIGNIWEWKTEIHYGYSRIDFAEIISDTLIGERNYFIQRTYASVNDELSGEHYTHNGRVYLRYDTLTTTVRALTKPDGEEWEYTCKLSAAFGDVVECDTFQEAYVEGQYADTYFNYITIGGEEVPFAAAKNFGNIGGTEAYYHGIGRIPGLGDGNVGSIYFSFLRIGGEEYGSRSIRIDIEKNNVIQNRLSELYPNPVATILNIQGEVNLLNIKVYDSVGRQIEVKVACDSRRCQLDVSNLAVGVYYLLIEDEQGNRKADTFAVKR